MSSRPPRFEIGELIVAPENRYKKVPVWVGLHGLEKLGRTCGPFVVLSTHFFDEDNEEVIKVLSQFGVGYVTSRRFLNRVAR